MAYGTKYIMAFSNELNEVYEVYFDYLNYEGGISNDMGMIDALTLRCIGGDEDRLYPICGTECMINVLVGTASIKGVVVNDSTLTIFDLIASQDNQIRITVYKDQIYTKSIFQGFVVVENNSQPFMDPPFNLSIRALDGLGLLKGVDMVDLNGQLYAGLLSVQDWIGNILYKTGQTLNIRYYFPFYPLGSNSVQPALQQIFINAESWQTGQITTTTDPSVDLAALEADDAYTVLEKLCRCFRCKLFQQDGTWNFVSLYSYVDPNGFAYNEATMTVVSNLISMVNVATGVNINYDIPVGKEQVLHLSGNDSVLYLKLATQWIKLTYTYNQSVNKICNQSLQLGNPNPTYNGTIPSSIYDPTIVPAITFNTIGYDAFCFTHMDNNNVSPNISPFPAIAPLGRGYVTKVVDALGYPLDTFLVLETTTHSSSYFQASSLLIDQGDIIQMSFSWRTYTNIHTSLPSSHSVAAICLTGDDGTFWALRCIGDGSLVGNPNIWVACDSNFHQIAGGFPDTPEIGTEEITDTNTWVTVNVNQNITLAVISAVKAPTSGSISIFFIWPFDLEANAQIWYKNINITILPYLQGTYTQLNGDYNYSTSIQHIKQTESDDVEISDSPKRYFKGALLQSNGNLWTPAWHRLGVLEAARFTQLMERIMFNMLTRQVQKLEGTIRGLTWVDSSFNVRQAGMFNRYYFTEHPVPTKKFMLTSFEKDLGTGSGRHVFVEILTDANDTGFLDPNNPAYGSYLFQYIFQS